MANDKYSLLEEKNAMLARQVAERDQKIKILETENQTLHLNFQKAEQKIRQLEKQISIIHNSNPDGYVCDHCASPSLTRKGSRPDPTFGDLGIKQKIFSCDACGKESTFTSRDKDI